MDEIEMRYAAMQSHLRALRIENPVIRDAINAIGQAYTDLADRIASGEAPMPSVSDSTGLWL